MLQGNAFYKGKQWNKAASYYTQAIELNKSNATYYCNRAAAFLELGWCDSSCTWFVVVCMMFYC